MTRLLLPLLLLLGAACATTGARAGSGLDDLTVLRGLDATHTYSVRSGDDPEIAGYIVEFFHAPAGTTDEREWPAGTVLVQDVDLRTVGFLSRGGKAYRFVGEGAAVDTQPVAAQGRHAQIAALLGVARPLEIRSALPGVEPPATSRVR